MRLCPWTRSFLSLASRGSVLGRAVLGLGFFCALSLGLGLEPCVLDSTSGMNYCVSSYRHPILMCYVTMTVLRLKVNLRSIRFSSVFLRFCFSMKKYALFRPHFYMSISVLTRQSHTGQKFSETNFL